MLFSDSIKDFGLLTGKNMIFRQYIELTTAKLTSILDTIRTFDHFN